MLIIKKPVKMIDHSILQPTHTDEDLLKQYEVAMKYNIASVLWLNPMQLKRLSKNSERTQRQLRQLTTLEMKKNILTSILTLIIACLSLVIQSQDITLTSPANQVFTERSENYC